MDLLCVTMLLPDITALDLGSYRGSLGGGTGNGTRGPTLNDGDDVSNNINNNAGDGAGAAAAADDGNNNDADAHNNAADAARDHVALLRDLRHGARHGRFPLGCKQWQTNLLAMGQQCYRLRTLVLAGPALGALTEEILLPLANGCSMVEHLELGGGDAHTRMDFLSLCGALRIWRHLRTFRYNGELDRGRWNPPRQGDREQTYGDAPDRLSALHFTCAVLTKAMLVYLSPLVARLCALTLHINHSDQVMALVQMGRDNRAKSLAQAGSPGGASKYEDEDDDEEDDEEEGRDEDEDEDEDNDDDYSRASLHSPGRGLHRRRRRRRRRHGRRSGIGRAGCRPHNFSGLLLEDVRLIKPPGKWAPPLKSEAVAKLVTVCPRLVHLSVQGLQELDRQLFTALAQKEGPAIESLVLPGYLNWRSSVERGLARLVSAFSSLTHVSLSNLNDVALAHLASECGHVLRTLHASRSPNITDKGLAALGPERCPRLCDLALDDVDVSTSAVLAFAETSRVLRKLYLANRSPIVSDASLLRILQAGAGRALTHLWLTNTLTTEAAPEMLVAAAVAAADGDAKSDNNTRPLLPGALLMELFVSEFSTRDAVLVGREWPQVRVLLPGEVFGSACNGMRNVARAGMYEDTRSRVLQQWLRASASSGLSASSGMSGRGGVGVAR
jgi:hypothetical protein